jgi:PAS domain S-box-containing protein
MRSAKPKARASQRSTPRPTSDAKRRHPEGDQATTAAKNDYAVLERINDGIVVFDSQMNYTFVNQRGGELLGRRPGELIGKNYWQEYPEAKGSPFANAYVRALETQQPIVFEDYYAPWDRWFENRIYPSRDGLAIFFTEITERKRAERLLQAELQVLEKISSGSPLAEILEAIALNIEALSREILASILLLEPGGNRIRYGAAPHLPGDYNRAIEGMLIGPQAGSCGTAMYHRKPVIVTDIETDPLWDSYRELARQHGLRACWSTPVISSDGAVLASFALYYREPRSPEREDLILIERATHLVQIAIERKRAQEQVDQQLQRISALHAIDKAITGNMELPRTLNSILEHVVIQLGVDAAAVWLVNAGSNRLELAAGRGFRGGGIPPVSLRLGEDYTGQVVRDRRLVSIPNLTLERPFSQAHLAHGEEFVAYFGLPLMAKGEINGVLEVFCRAPFAPPADWLGFLEALAGQVAIAIDSAHLLEGLQRSNFNLLLAYETTIEGWSRALDLRDKETEGHTQRVTELTLRLARAAGMAEDELANVRRGALLHDIGKMGVPDHILLKPGKLTAEEWEHIRRHPVFAYELLSPIEFLQGALAIPYCHHEKWDGTGYPRGLKGEEIPLAARLFAVADVWDALRSDRPYRAAWPEEKVLEHIRSQAGTHFDPAAVELFLKVMTGAD